MSFDPQLQRKIFAQFATGVTVVGVEVDGQTRGMTANAVSSLSLDPPLVLVCVSRTAEFHGWITKAPGFSLSILGADQRPLSDRFAFVGPKDFSELPTRTAETGAPFLEQSIGWVDCRPHAVLDGGDHEIFVGRVVAGELGEGPPLLYYGGGYREVEALT